MNPDAVVFPPVCKAKDYPAEVPLCLVPAEREKFFWPLDYDQYDKMQYRGVKADQKRIDTITLSDLEKDLQYMREKGLAGLPIYNYGASKLLKRKAAAGIVYGNNSVEF